jgi:hypothetical protein
VRAPEQEPFVAGADDAPQCFRGPPPNFAAVFGAGSAAEIREFLHPKATTPAGHLGVLAARPVQLLSNSPPSSPTS